MTDLTWGIAVVAALGAALLLVLWLAHQSRRALLSWYGRTAERTIERIQGRIEPFKLARRPEIHRELLEDPGIREAIAEHAEEHGMSREATTREVDRYIREIVPFFNVLSYYRLGYAISRWLISLLYRVRIVTRDVKAPQRIPDGDVVVYLMNHRSNADYVVLAFVLSGTVSISYAVGEWARTWPLEYIFKSFGSYFIRRRYRVPLYHKVLERYVQLITRNGVTQGIFPEGGLTRDGALRPSKLGLLDYLIRTLADRNFAGDIWLVPVGINYDRVLEDRTLIQERIVGTRTRGRFRQFGSVIHYVSRNLLRLAVGRFRRYGEVAVAFGSPMSVREWLAGKDRDVLSLPRHERLGEIERLAGEALERIGRVVPVTPVPLAACALLSFGASVVPEDRLLERMDELRDRLLEVEAVFANPRATTADLWRRAWRMLQMRRLVVRQGGGEMLVIMPRQRPLLEYYANSLAHLLPDVTAASMTPAAEPDPTLPRLARRDEMSIRTGSYAGPESVASNDGDEEAGKAG